TARIEKTLGWIMTATDLPELRDDQKRVNEMRAKRPDYSSMSNEEVLTWVRKTAPLFRELFHRHLYTTYASTVPVGLISGVCAEGLGDPTLAMRLVAGIGDVDSAAPSFAMWDLGQTAAATPAVAEESGQGTPGLRDRLRGKPEATGFLDGFVRFIDDSGSRGPNEWEARSPPWEPRREMPLAAA